MIFFTVKNAVTIDIQSNYVHLNKMEFQPPPASSSGGPPPPKFIYCCNVTEFVRIGSSLEQIGRLNDLQVIPEAQILSRNDFPKLLGVSNRGEWERNLYASGKLKFIDDKIINPDAVNLADQLSGFRNKRVRIAIFNGLGAGIGDTLMGLAALSKACDLIAKIAEPIFEVVYSRDQFFRLAHIYQHTPLVNKVHVAPLTLEQLVEFDAIFDTGGMANRQDFDKMVTVDFFLKYLGLNPIEIPDEEKRSTLIHLAPENELSKCIEEIRKRNPEKKLILFHPLASTPLRTIPVKYVEGIVRYLGGVKEFTLVAVVPLPGKDLPIANLSSQCKTFKDLCFIVSQMDGIFTVDTSIYHIAACFDIPTVVWFTSINPELRVKYYPTVTGILLDGARQMSFYNKHILGKNDNYANVEKLWGDLDLDRTVRDLKSLCAERNT